VLSAACRSFWNTLAVTAVYTTLLFGGLFRAERFARRYALRRLGSVATRLESVRLQQSAGSRRPRVTQRGANACQEKGTEEQGGVHRRHRERVPEERHAGQNSTRPGLRFSAWIAVEEGPTPKLVIRKNCSTRNVAPLMRRRVRFSFKSGRSAR